MPEEQEQTLTIQQAIDLALQHHTAGDLPKAEAIYQQILQADQNQPVALHLLGVIAHQVGKNDTAVDFIKKAITINPDYAEAHSNLGLALQVLGKLDEAVTSYNKAIAIKPDYAEAHSNLGNIFRDLGKFDEAVTSCNKSIAIKPDYAEAHSNLGITFQNLGKLDEAVESLGRTLAIKPDFEEAHYNLGNILRDLGQLDEAVASYSKALAIRPDYAEAHSNLGTVLQKLGKIDESVVSYTKALAINPHFADAHFNLGGSLQELGQLDGAVASYIKVLSIKPDYAEAHYNLGNVLQELKKHNEAVESFNKALAIKPDFAEARSNLGNAFKDLEKIDEAVFSYKKALAIKPDYALAHSNLGLALQELGKFDKAITSYNKAIAINPNYAEAHYNLGNALQELGQLDEAVTSYSKALAIRPDYAEAHNNLGQVLQELGKQNDAFVHRRRAIKLDPENNIFWAGLAHSLQFFFFTTIDDDLLQDLLLLIDKPTVRPIDTTLPVISALSHHTEFTLALKIAETPKPDSLLNFQYAAAQLSGIPLFLRLISLTHTPDLKVERMLTTLRRLMLQEAIAGKIKNDGLLFASALALHCFTNEYVFAETDEEILSVEHLEKQISKFVEQKQDVPSPLIVTLGAYRPLHKFDWAQGLTEHAWGKEVSVVIERQVLEPFTELSLRPQIPCLTPVQDTVSRLVRDQYEESPYPRWIRTGLVEKDEYIGAILTAPPLRFDLGDYETPNNPEVLIAGCGTGQHSLGTASRFKDARVLAIDLSLSSLAYAARKTNELGVTNIEYAQADIMELSTLDRQFDLIESAGVLHHLGDPMAGWKVLADLLKPGGLMKIALYSEMARQHIVSARSMITEMGYTSSDKDIRQCRQDIIARVENGDRSLEKLFNMRDFFSLSECRDLLFHVQEHRFTIPQIIDALDVLNLKFLGFEMQDQSVMTRFKEICQKKGGLTSLDLWHEFEQQHPDTFIGMYQFWCIKQ